MKICAWCGARLIGWGHLLSTHCKECRARPRPGFMSNFRHLDELLAERCPEEVPDGR